MSLVSQLLCDVLYEKEKTNVAINLMAAVHQSPCKSLQYIHSNFKGYLHNDLKLDNIVIGNTVNRKLKPYTFGKVCPIKNGKKYFRRDTEKEVYKTEHPQVAPE